MSRTILSLALAAVAFAGSSFGVHATEMSTEVAQNPEGSSVTIGMVGDILLHTPVENAALSDDGSYNFDFIFEKTGTDISSFDIAIVNQEVIIGGTELGISGYPAFNAPYAIGDALAKAGFDVVCHATNHALDKGEKGLKNTMDFWSENHPQMEVLGIRNSNENRSRVFVCHKNGIKIAILNYTYGTNGITISSKSPYSVDLLEKESVIKDLDFAEKNADFTIVCPHWGVEYNHGISSDEKKWLKIFKEHGADLVIGTHPHVIEPIEFLDDGDGVISNNKGDGDILVYYSLGNFVNWTSGKGKGVADRMVGGMAMVTLKKAPGNDAVISDYGVKALVCHVTDGKEGVKVYPISRYTDTLGEANKIRLQDSSFSKKYCVDLCNSIWGSLWK